MGDGELGWYNAVPALADKGHVPRWALVEGLMHQIRVGSSFLGSHDTASIIGSEGMDEYWNRGCVPRALLVHGDSSPALPAAFHNLALVRILLDYIYVFRVPCCPARRLQATNPTVDQDRLMYLRWYGEQLTNGEVRWDGHSEWRSLEVSGGVKQVIKEEGHSRC